MFSEGWCSCLWSHRGTCRRFLRGHCLRQGLQRRDKDKQNRGEENWGEGGGKGWKENKAAKATDGTRVPAAIDTFKLSGALPSSVASRSRFTHYPSLFPPTPRVLALRINDPSTPGSSKYASRARASPFHDFSFLFSHDEQASLFLNLHPPTPFSQYFHCLFLFSIPFQPLSLSHTHSFSIGSPFPLFFLFICSFFLRILIDRSALYILPLWTLASSLDLFLRHDTWPRKLKI